MTIRSTLLLAGALLAGVTSQANAVTATVPSTDTSGNAGESVPTIFGGGSSLIAPYIREAADCFADKIDLGSNGKSATTNIASFNYSGNPPATCGKKGLVKPNNVVSYISTGSGRGFLGYFSHNPLYSMGQGNKDTWLFDGTSTAATPQSANPYYATKVDFAAADAGLPRTDPNFGGDINTYVNGGYVSANKISIQIAQQNGTAPTGAAPSGTIVTTLYPNPLKTYGPAIQIPLLVAAPVVAFSPVYKKVRTSATAITFYRFSTAATPGSLKLTNPQLCSIFTGQISNWNQLPTSTVNKDPRDPAAFSVPLQIVGRSDGSGTTSIVFRHLAKVCPGSSYAIQAAANGGNVPTKLPDGKTPNTVNLQGPVTDPNNPNASPAGETPTKFTLANGSGGVANYIAFLANPTNVVGNTVVQGRIGYIGEDFVLPYVIQNNQNQYGLFSASLQNAKGAFVASTPTSAAIAASVVTPPSASNRSDPAANTTAMTWVAAANTMSPLADPNPTTAGSYPLVGTTNGLFYQCYADATEASLVRSFLSWYYSSPIVNDTTRGILAKNGFAPVSSAYSAAITDAFITNASKLGLDIEQTGTNAACTGVKGA